VTFVVYAFSFPAARSTREKTFPQFIFSERADGRPVQGSSGFVNSPSVENAEAEDGLLSKPLTKFSEQLEYATVLTSKNSA
jgi:hypothetical protein